MFLPNSYSFLLVRSVKPVIQSGIQGNATSLSSSSSSDSGRKVFLPNSHSFLLIRKPSVEPGFTPEAGNLVADTSQSTGGEQPKVNDQSKRNFLKMAGVAGAGIAAATLLPSKAHALIMGSSPTTGVVGVKNAANTRINPATQETVSTLLKTSDLTFDAGSLQVKVTSLPATGNSFSDSGNVAKNALVDVDRHVQVDVLSSALPITASTETTLQTISFGGSKFALRMTTVGSVDYIGEAAVGTVASSALWRAKKVDSTTGIIITWADGNANFDNVATDLTALTYS